MNVMPRAGWTKPDSESRLSDHLAFAMLARVYPPDIVDQIVADVGRLQQRNRLLPARIVVYYVLGLAMFSHSSYDEVIRLLIASQSWSSGWSQSWPVPTKAALYNARLRLGYEPIQLLFERVAKPLAESGDGFHRSWRVLGIDTVLIDMPDTEANCAEFRRRASQDAPQPGPPAARVVGLTEIATGAVIGASIESINGNSSLSLDFLSLLGPESLVIVEFGVLTPEQWAVAAASGAQLLSEVPPEITFEKAQALADGSFVSASISTDQHPVGVSLSRLRVLESISPDRLERRFVTTISDPDALTSLELQALISRHRNRSLASTFDEFRAHRTSSAITLRSKLPDGVRQEIYGYLCVHYAMRWLLYELK